MARSLLSVGRFGLFILIILLISWQFSIFLLICNLMGSHTLAAKPSSSEHKGSVSMEMSASALSRLGANLVRPYYYHCLTWTQRPAIHRQECCLPAVPGEGMCCRPLEEDMKVTDLEPEFFRMDLHSHTPRPPSPLPQNPKDNFGCEEVVGGTKGAGAPGPLS